MELICCKDYEEMSRKAAETVAACLKKKPDGLLSFPGGETPLGMVQHFVKMVNEGEVDISRANYVSLDEWVGLGPDTLGSCAQFNRDNLFTPLQKEFANIHIINGANSQIEEECEKLDAYFAAYGPLTVSVLGIGMNGHLGFNEEGSDFNAKAHTVPLSPVTIGIMSKYFTEELPLTHGITQGLAQIMQADTVILIAAGEKKAEIVHRAMRGEVTESVPASILQRHPNCICVMDEAACRLL